MIHRILTTATPSEIHFIGLRNTTGTFEANDRAAGDEHELIMFGLCLLQPYVFFALAFLRGINCGSMARALKKYGLLV